MDVGGYEPYARTKWGTYSRLSVTWVLRLHARLGGESILYTFVVVVFVENSVIFALSTHQTAPAQSTRFCQPRRLMLHHFHWCPTLAQEKRDMNIVLLFVSLLNSAPVKKNKPWFHKKRFSFYCCFWFATAHKARRRIIRAVPR